MTKRNNSAAKAKETCQARRADCQNLLQHLADLLAGQAEGEQSWGEAGNLGHVKELLTNAVAFYGGLEEKDIEETLAEARS